MPTFLILLVLSLAAFRPPTSMQMRAPQTPPAIAKIRAAIGTLQMPSETDAPMRVEFWPSDTSEAAPAQIARWANAKTQTSVETQTVEQFFASAVGVEDWMSADEKATARRFQDLVQVLNAEMENPRVYLFGERERTVVIIGKVKDGFGGVVTLVVET